MANYQAIINYKAVRATLAAIRMHGKIEDFCLVSYMEESGWEKSDIEWALVRIMDNVLHGLWATEMGNLTVTIEDAKTPTGEDSWAFCWNG